jgi:hypothetical protein
MRYFASWQDFFEKNTPRAKCKINPPGKPLELQREWRKVWSVTGKAEKCAQTYPQEQVMLGKEDARK